MMKLTTFSDYTLRVLMILAVAPGRRVTVPAIAAAYGISENHLMKVVGGLVRAGTVVSSRGKGGGIRLARPPGAIRLGQVVRASEGEAAIVECLGDSPANCRVAPACRLAPILVEAFEALYTSLDRHTLADLVAKPESLVAILLPEDS